MNCARFSINYGIQTIPSASHRDIWFDPVLFIVGKSGTRIKPYAERLAALLHTCCPYAGTLLGQCHRQSS